MSNFDRQTCMTEAYDSYNTSAVDSSGKLQRYSSAVCLGQYDNCKFGQGSSALSRNKGKPAPVPGGASKKRLLEESCINSSPHRASS